MGLQDVWSYVFENEIAAENALKAINIKFGPIGTIGKDNKNLLVLSAEEKIMSEASEIAKKMGGKLKGPSLTWG